MRRTGITTLNYLYCLINTNWSCESWCVLESTYIKAMLTDISYDFSKEVLRNSPRLPCICSVADFINSTHRCEESYSKLCSRRKPVFREHHKLVPRAVLSCSERKPYSFSEQYIDQSVARAVTNRFARRAKVFDSCNIIIAIFSVFSDKK